MRKLLLIPVPHWRTAGRALSTLLILNDAPYGNERSYNALRLARALAAEKKHFEARQIDRLDRDHG